MQSDDALGPSGPLAVGELCVLNLFKSSLPQCLISGPFPLFTEKHCYKTILVHNENGDLIEVVQNQEIEFMAQLLDIISIQYGMPCDVWHMKLPENEKILKDPLPKTNTLYVFLKPENNKIGSWYNALMNVTIRSAITVLTLF